MEGPGAGRSMRLEGNRAEMEGRRGRRSRRSEAGTGHWLRRRWYQTFGGFRQMTADEPLLDRGEMKIDSAVGEALRSRVWIGIGALILDNLPLFLLAGSFITLLTRDLGANVFLIIATSNLIGSSVGFFISFRLGSLSQPERFGRRNMLLACGAVTSFILPCIYLESGKLFILVDCFIRCTGSKYPNGGLIVLCAWVTDWAEERNKTILITMLNASVAVSLIVGNAIGGLAMGMGVLSIQTLTLFAMAIKLSSLAYVWLMFQPEEAPAVPGVSWLQVFHTLSQPIEKIRGALQWTYRSNAAVDTDEPPSESLQCRDYGNAVAADNHVLSHPSIGVGKALSNVQAKLLAQPQSIAPSPPLPFGAIQASAPFYNFENDCFDGGAPTPSTVVSPTESRLHDFGVSSTAAASSYSTIIARDPDETSENLSKVVAPKQTPPWNVVVRHLFVNYPLLMAIAVLHFISLESNMTCALPFLTKNLQLSSQDVSIFLSICAAVAILAQVVALPFMRKGPPMHFLAIVGCLSQASENLVVAMADRKSLAYFAGVIGTWANVVFPVLLGFLAKCRDSDTRSEGAEPRPGLGDPESECRADYFALDDAHDLKDQIERDQGLVLGGFAAVRCICSAVGPLMIALLLQNYTEFPAPLNFPSLGFVVIASLMLVACILAVIYSMQSNGWVSANDSANRPTTSMGSVPETEVGCPSFAIRNTFEKRNILT